MVILLPAMASYQKEETINIYEDDVEVEQVLTSTSCLTPILCNWADEGLEDEAVVEKRAKERDAGSREEKAEVSLGIILTRLL